MTDSRDRLMLNEIASAKQEQMKLIALVDETVKSRTVWQKEYLRILTFDGNYASCVKNFRKATERVMRLLDMQPIQNKQIVDSIETLEGVMALADRFELNSTKPMWLTAPAKEQAAFDFYYESTYGREADHLDPHVQELFRTYQIGASAASSEVHRNVRREWAEGKIIPLEKL